MQKLISKYGLAAHLALVAVAPLFLPPAAVIWLSALAAVWLVMEPSRIGNERLHGARRRVAVSIFKDPLFWICLSLLVIAVIRTLNTGVALAYDAEAGKWFVSSPAFPLLPGSVEGAAFPLVGSAAAALVVIQGCRHGLGRSARAAFALVASSLSALGGIVQAMRCHDGVKEVLEAANCLPTDPSFSGCVYGMYLVLAVMSLMACLENHWLRAMPLTILGVAGNLLGLFLFSPSVVAAAYVLAVLIVMVYAFVYMKLRIGRSAEFKYLVFFGFGAALAVLATAGLIAPAMVDARLAPFTTGAFAPEGFFETRSALSDIAVRVWKANPWMGDGLGSYAMSLQFNASVSDWSVVPALQKAIPNGYWQLLTERGVIGAFFLAVPLALLAFNYVRRLVKGVRVTLPNPLAWTGLVLFVVAGLEMLVDVSFLSPAPMVALAAVLSLSASAFPKELKKNVR